MAAGSVTASDPRNDTVDYWRWAEDDRIERVPAVPEGDVRSVSVDYRADAHVYLSMATGAAPPASNQQDVWWDVDTGRDVVPEFEVWADNYSRATATYEVTRLADGAVRCRGTIGSPLSLKIPARCFDTPSAISAGGALLYATDANVPDRLVTLDFAPDEDYLPRLARPVFTTVLDLATPARVGYGDIATLTGTLKDRAGAPARGVTVTLYRRPASSTTWSRGAARTTDSAGTVVFRERPLRNMEYQLRATGTARFSAARSGSTVVRVAANKVRISRVQYDSPGRDDRSNRSLNGEWVRLTNTGTRAQTLTGWALRDAQGNIYTFPELRLAAERSVTVRTGRGTDTASNLYWGSRRYIWNNDRDTATLLNWRGTTLQSCSWTTTGRGYRNC